MKSKAKLLLIMILSFLMLEAAVFATEQNDVPRKYRLTAYTKAVEKELGHKVEDFEKSIIDVTYSYYGNACQNNWDKESWKEAVAKAVELCRNKIAVAAAKAGEFGEKLLKALIQTTKEAGNSISDWLDQKSQEYDKQSEKDKKKNDKKKDDNNKKSQKKKSDNSSDKVFI
jgi:hypothetical protein